MLAYFANTLLGFVEIGGNRLLSLDHQVIDRCRELQGHCIKIHITDLDFTVYCHPGNWGIRLGLDQPAKPIDATISGRVMALLSLAMQEDKISTSMQEGVSINGNAVVAQQVQKIFADLDLDWEEALSQYIGDIPAYQVHRQARRATKWLCQSVTSLSRTSSEYLREEIHLTPTQVEFEHFKHQATRLKQDVERAEVRLRHLIRSIKK